MVAHTSEGHCCWGIAALAIVRLAFEYRVLYWSMVESRQSLFREVSDSLANQPAWHGGWHNGRIANSYSGISNLDERPSSIMTVTQVPVEPTHNNPDVEHAVEHVDDDGAPSHPLHKVLSFVRRSARLDARLQRAWDNYADTYLLDIAAGNGPLDVREGFSLTKAYIHSIWGNDNPLIVEIGTGQGENVVAAAAAHPEINFLALEVYDPGVAHTLLLAGKQNLTNIRIAQVNAAELFKVTETGVLAEVWTFFPDPWPKKKHHKRRIVQPALADNIHHALRQDGVWRIATDIEDYALHVHEVMDHREGWENLGTVAVSLPLEHVGKGNADMADGMPHADFIESERFEGRVLTNFEKKGIDAGRVIHDFTYRANAL
ncbi:tRNA (guanine-N(7)-)-methyltransferase [Bifidobacterium reuteri DSM 23975]|uniref:tRNA (guanine-N(7)-)-methyltransferase n=2 Tax=Bifidobacterium reuteri TaxID=983706 RepID=A0A087CTS8_9BIFI|nr:tRNA (guanine-N(7)-)-methyltransferase [Bifidobacterium reuteri DSM 23975]TPF80673.1 tRNA (guanine-N7)-methyltransferase [Bifidobacterium sp. UTCIF-24]TPF90148.1 tRNA (guanine-N7)-methyltransferase [Bifidobacterium sp. UTBIF-56]